MAHLLVDWQIT